MTWPVQTHWRGAFVYFSPKEATAEEAFLQEVFDIKPWILQKVQWLCTDAGGCVGAGVRTVPGIVGPSFRVICLC